MSQMPPLDEPHRALPLTRSFSSASRRFSRWYRVRSTLRCFMLLLLVDSSCTLAVCFRRSAARSSCSSLQSSSAPLAALHEGR